MNECREVAINIAAAFRQERGEYAGLPALHDFIYARLRDESYNVMDQVEAHAKNILWPHVHPEPIDG